MKHCQDRHKWSQHSVITCLKSALSHSAHSYWSDNILHQWVRPWVCWTWLPLIYWSRGNCYTENGNSISKMCSRCGQIIAQAATDRLALWQTTKQRWRSTRTMLYALLPLRFVFPVLARVKSIANIPNIPSGQTKKHPTHLKLFAALLIYFHKTVQLWALPLRTSDYPFFNPKEGFHTPNCNSAQLSIFLATWWQHTNILPDLLANSNSIGVVCVLCSLDIFTLLWALFWSPTTPE